MLGQYELRTGKEQRQEARPATRKLEAAVKALKEPAEGYTPIGPRYPTTSSGAASRSRVGSQRKTIR